MNIPLLRKVQRAILEEPRRIDMREWIKATPREVKRILKSGDTIYSGRRAALNVPCNTVGCIAGWTIALTKHVRGYSKLENIFSHLEAAKVLDLSEILYYRLFYVNKDVFTNDRRWPDVWVDKLNSLSPQTRAYAEHVARYIDYFIIKHATDEEILADKGRLTIRKRSR